MANLDDLTRRAQAVHDRYRRDYAGRSRVLCDPEPLVGLTGELQQIRAQATGVKGDKDALLRQIDEWTDLYRREREAITQARAGGPDEAVAARVADVLILVRHSYRRHFAGQERASRDLGLLDDLRARLRRARSELENLAARHEEGWKSDLFAAIDGELAIHDAERKEIPRARQQLAMGPWGTALAKVANSQFDQYRLHFQGRSRTTRRPALLERIVRNLEDTLAEMEALKARGFVSEPNDNNIRTVRERIGYFRNELALVKNARAAAKASDRASALADEANAVFKEYRETIAGKPRQTADGAALAALCDRLDEIGRAMAELHGEVGIEVNARNLETVTATLKRYEAEHQAVRAAQAPAAT